MRSRLRFASAVAVLGVLTGCTPPPPEPIHSFEQVEVEHVTDGDTLRVTIDGTEERVRILGIDTPELEPPEPCASEATDRLTDLIDEQPVTLTRDPAVPERDRYDRILAYVETATGEDTGAVLLSEGLAEIYRAQEHMRTDDYRAAAEKAATPPCTLNRAL